MGIWGIFAAAWSLGLTLSDVRFQRLPDWLTLPAFAPACALCVIDPGALWGLVWPAAYLFVGTRIGGGDIKLAVPLGVGAAWCAGLPGVLAAIGVSGLLTACVGMLARSRTVPHGPAMLAAAWGVAGVAGLPV
ncbi:prepilin peptidase [Corynebacterium sp. TA-R-1]|uniref:Prepilin peptidase n=1 Tax=Corynebacterium stercoris TaxID=2943490 RepID=A0ABT1G285_9CORY|nr:prepilin peptidase [Corynebacterium stercoris]MCP1387163.1 prepilin peptidase [Corynebacterium stercoris]